jgi:hypothetical protein
MPAHDMVTDIGFDAVVMSLAAGTLMGLLPYVMGIQLGQERFGRIGLAMCVIGGLVGGIFIALPLSIVFASTLWARAQRAKKKAAAKTVTLGNDS